jgi:predicted DNA-binding transcriptional regulator AlpA
MSTVTPAMQWLDAEGVAQLIGVGARQVRERIACRPDFPTPLRIGGVGHPRWRADEVSRWLNTERERQAGRKRARKAA